MEAKERLLDEVLKAEERVGRKAEDKMRWLLRFVSLDLPKLSAGDLLNLQYEMRYFSIFGMFFGDGFRESAFLYGPNIHARRPDVLPSRDILVEWQKRVQTIIEAVLKRQKLNFALPHIEVTVFPGCPDSEYWGIQVTSEDLTGPVVLSISALVAIMGGRVRQCIGCKTLFVAERTNQDYHNAACQSRAATRRFREKHGLLTGRPRGRPRKTKQAGQKKELRKES